jgi:hypothetical protein
VIGKLEFEQGKDPPPFVCVEPAHIPIEGILPASALTRVECSPSNTSRMTSQAEHMLANFSDETLTVPKWTVLGIAEEA